MRTSGEDQAIFLRSLETRRHEILRELAGIHRQITETEEQRDHLEEQLRALAHTQSNAA